MAKGRHEFVTSVKCPGRDWRGASTFAVCFKLSLTESLFDAVWVVGQRVGGCAWGHGAPQSPQGS